MKDANAFQLHSDNFLNRLYNDNEISIHLTGRTIRRPRAEIQTTGRAIPFGLRASGFLVILLPNLIVAILVHALSNRDSAPLVIIFDLSNPKSESMPPRVDHPRSPQQVRTR